MAVFQSLTLTQLGQDIGANTSQLHLVWESTQTGGSYNNTPRAATYWVSVNGGTELTDTMACTLPWRETTALADVVLTIPHNEKGEATVTVRTWMDTHISAGVVELSKTIVLTKIPCASTLTASDGYIGGTSMIAVNKKQENDTHSIAWQFGQLQGYLTESGQLTDQETQMRETSVLMQLPQSFYRQIPNAREAECHLTCRTYCDGAQVGESQSCSFRVEVRQEQCQPVVSGSIADINEKTLALTGDETVLVQGESTAYCTIQAQAVNEATIDFRFIGGVVLEEQENNLIVDKVDGNLFFTATDSRGFTQSILSENRVIPYFAPTAKATVVRTHPTDGTAALTVEGTCYPGSFGAVDNVLTVRYQIGTNDWQQLTVEPLDGHYQLTIELTGMDYTKVHAIGLRVCDCLHTIEKSLILKKSMPVFDWGEEDFRFHVPVAIEGSLSVNGQAILSLPELLEALYPVGAVYLCSPSCSPAVLFGGVWQILSQENEICQWLRTA